MHTISFRSACNIGPLKIKIILSPRSNCFFRSNKFGTPRMDVRHSGHIRIRRNLVSGPRGEITTCTCSRVFSIRPVGSHPHSGEIRARRYEGNLIPVEKAPRWISLLRRDFPDRSPEIRGTNDYGSTNQVSSGIVYGYTTGNNNQHGWNGPILCDHACILRIETIILRIFT